LKLKLSLIKARMGCSVMETFFASCTNATIQLLSDLASSGTEFCVKNRAQIPTLQNKFKKNFLNTGSRVTRLGEFLPIGRLFTPGFLNYRSMLCFRADFSTVKALVLTKNVLGYVLCDFFTNSSGERTRDLCFSFLPNGPSL
jgi:hypothetical protein